MPHPIKSAKAVLIFSHFCLLLFALGLGGGAGGDWGEGVWRELEAPSKPQTGIWEGLGEPGMGGIGGRWGSGSPYL